VLFPVSLREAAATGLVLAALRWAGVVAWLSGCGYGRGGEQVVAVFQFDEHELGHVGPADRVEHQIQTRAARPSIGLHTLASYWHDPRMAAGRGSGGVRSSMVRKRPVPTHRNGEDSDRASVGQLSGSR